MPRLARVFALASLLAAGCGSGASPMPPTGRLTGTVVDKGKPVANAEVRLVPDKGPAASGRTDAGGKFTLLLPNGQPGAVVGPNKALVITGGVPAEAVAPSPDREIPLAPAAPSFQYSFADPIAVTAGENKAELDLATAAKRRF